MEKSSDDRAAGEQVPPLSEAEFLAEQAEAARRAMSATLERIRADLGDSADLSAWARRHPWPTMGVAAAAGFLAVVALGSAGTARSAESSTETDESDLADQPPRSRRSRGTRQAEAGGSLFQTLLSEILRNFANAAQGRSWPRSAHVLGRHRRLPEMHLQ